MVGRKSGGRGRSVTGRGLSNAPPAGPSHLRSHAMMKRTLLALGALAALALTAGSASAQPGYYGGYGGGYYHHHYPYGYYPPPVYRPVHGPPVPHVHRPAHRPVLRRI